MPELLLVANALWFGGGFNLFALRRRAFARTLVPREHRDSPAFDVLAESGMFLGGFNFALCAFSLAVLFLPQVFANPEQRAVLFLFFAIAHGSQFSPNLPVALANRRNEGVWRVAGLMRFIFITDFTLMMANGAVATFYF